MSALEWEISAPAPKAPRPAGSEIDAAVAARDYERAERLLAEAAARQPESRDLLLQIAAVFMMDRKPLNAAIALKKAEVLGPLDNQARLQLALAYIAMRRGDWARPELERLVQAEPSEVIYPYWLARLDYDAGQYADAIRRLESVLRGRRSCGEEGEGEKGRKREGAHHVIPSERRGAAEVEGSAGQIPVEKQIPPLAQSAAHWAAAMRSVGMTFSDLWSPIAGLAVPSSPASAPAVPGGSASRCRPRTIPRPPRGR
jgi:tetratricopeptide (TPR) repeat protein